MPSTMSEQADDTVEHSGIVRSTLALTLTPARLAINPGKARLNWRLDLENAGDAHIVGLRIWSDCLCTRSVIPDPAALTGPDTLEGRLRQVRVLAPGEKESIAGEWDIARANFVPFLASQNKILLLARLRVVGAGILPAKHGFLIGTPPMQDDAAPQAMESDGALQIYSNLVAQPLDWGKATRPIASDVAAP